jgi:hypothetical protein
MLGSRSLILAALAGLALGLPHPEADAEKRGYYTSTYPYSSTYATSVCESPFLPKDGSCERRQCHGSITFGLANR